MTAQRAVNAREYYDRITDVDIGEIARELLAGRITAETSTRLHCDCPRHQSQSHRSLHVRLDVQAWHCFGCGVGGDVLQLVEFIQSGRVTAGQSGQMPDSHRQARDWLATRAGLPPLGQYGLNPAQVARQEAQRAFETRVLDALTAIAQYYHERLLNHPEALDWLKAHYAINDATIEALRIGFAANGPWKDAQGRQRQDLKTAMLEQGFTVKELMGTSAFNLSEQKQVFAFFDRRLIFPYWSRGRVSFLIGRITPWTPKSRFEMGKYKKLPIRNEHQRPFVADCINNRTLWGEDCLLARPERLVITEGVTDAIALMQAGFPVVSPATTRISQKDWEHFLPRLRGVKQVFICQDNEASEAGLKGALQTAQQLTDNGIGAAIVTLPLGESQQTARQRLKTEFSIDTPVDPARLKQHLLGRAPEEVAEVNRLLGASKIDVNDYFRSGATAADFEALLSEAKDPIEFAICAIDADLPEAERNQRLNVALQAIAQRSAIEQNRLLKTIQTRFGKANLPMTALRAQMRDLARQERASGKRRKSEQRALAKHATPAPAGSCLERVQAALLATQAATGSPDFMNAAQNAFEWFREHGGMFFRTREGCPFMCFENDLYWMDAGDRGRRRKYAAFILKHTNIQQTTNGGRSFFDALASLAVTHGEQRDHFLWLHSDIPNQTIWFNLNNANHEIVRITPEGVEVMKNGANPDKIVLEYSSKMAPLRYLPEVDLNEADQAMTELLAQNFSCAQGDRFFILAWLSCFLLLDFAGTKPMTRFEGASGSGKTTAAKLITTLLYGEPQQKISTLAANYTDGAQNPLLALDNIEVQQMTDGLTEFMLTSITGVAREKRKGGTDTQNVLEHVKCLLNTTGIEPLRGDLSEILSRTFTIDFDIQAQTNPCFLDAEIVAAIQAKRDLIISAIMIRTSRVLAMIRAGARRRALAALQKALGPHDKRRCNDYLSLMYLISLAGLPDEQIEPLLDSPHQQFLDQVRGVNHTSRQTARGANPIAAALDTLFNAWSNAVALDEKARYSTDDRANHVASFIERYHLHAFDDVDTLSDVTAGQLCTAFNIVARQTGLNCQYKNAIQLGKRLRNDMRTIEEAGYCIHARMNRTGTNVYQFQRQ